MKANIEGMVVEGTPKEIAELILLFDEDSRPEEKEDETEAQAPYPEPDNALEPGTHLVRSFVKANGTVVDAYVKRSSKGWHKKATGNMTLIPGIPTTNATIERKDGKVWVNPFINRKGIEVGGYFRKPRSCFRISASDPVRAPGRTERVRKWSEANAGKFIPSTLGKIGKTAKRAWSKERIIKHLMKELPEERAMAEFYVLEATGALIPVGNDRYRAPYSVQVE